VRIIRLLLAVAIVGVVFVLSSASAPQAEAAFDNFGDSNNDGDTMLSTAGGGGNNYGSTDYATIEDNGGLAIIWQIPDYAAGTTFDNATLWVYSNYNDGTPEISLYELRTNWDENVVTYNIANAWVPRWGHYLNITERTGTGWHAYNVTDSMDNLTENGDGNWVAWNLVILAGGGVSQVRTEDYATAAQRPYLEVTYTLPTPESNIIIENVATDNFWVDRDNDGYSTGQLATLITATIYDNNGNDNIGHARISIRDNTDTLIVDNAAFDDNTVFDENRLRYTYLYNPADALTDGALGTFDVYIEVLDAGAGENEEWYYDNLIRVEDYVFTISVENLAGHNTRIYGTVSLVHADNVPDNLTIVDNNLGTYDLSPAVDNTWENTYYRPLAGEYYAYCVENGIDGEVADNVPYGFPNIVPQLVSVEVDNALIDNHRTDNAITATSIEIVFEDNDGFADFNDEFWFTLRDAADTLILDNENISSSFSYENENFAVANIVYDAEDNVELADAGMGAWDVFVYCADNWAENENWSLSRFTVDEMGITVNLAADNSDLLFAYNFNILATGAMSLKSGAISVDNSWLLDENAGEIILGAADSYSENYTITALPGTDNVYVRVRAYDGVLDGENFGYYDVNDNRLFEIEVRFEENFGLWPDGVGGDNAIENRNYHLTFYFDNQRREYDMSTNPENFVVFSDPYKIRLDFEDNGFWRSRIPVTPGTVTFVMPEDLDNMQSYTFTLYDISGTFTKDENGQLWLSRYYENDFMPIHEDYWMANDTVIGWLLIGEQYDVKLVTPTVERAAAPLTMGTSQNVSITVSAFVVTDQLEIWDYVYYAAWWDADNHIRVSYEDNQENTSSSTVRIWDENNDLAYSVSFTTDTWAVNWAGADPDTGYTVEIEITHENYITTFESGNLIVRTSLTAVWNAPLPSTNIPGTSQLGELPFAYGSAIGIFFAVVVGLMYGKRHAGVSILTIAMFLVILGPIMGVFTVPEVVIPMIAVIGILVMLVPKRGS